MRQCEQCGAVVNENWKACFSCGAKLKEIEAAWAYQYPVVIQMKSSSLGRTVRVELWPNRATVDGAEYSNKEMMDLKNRGFSHERLREIHEVKRSFEGQALTGEQEKEQGGDDYGRDNIKRATGYKFAG